MELECRGYSKQQQHSVLNEVIKSFGDYLTHQYEVLLRTLSFLNIDDLTRAALVCKSWNQAVNHIYRKRDKTNKFRWHTRSNNSCSLRETCFHDGIFFRSLSVIGFELPKYKHWLWRELLTPKYVLNKSSDRDNEDDDGCEFVVPGVMGDVFSVVADVVIAPNNEGVLKHSRNQAAAVFFPKIDGFSMKTISINRNSDLISAAPTLLHDNENPLKGLLIFDKGVDGNENIQQKLFDSLVDAVPAQPFAIAGGLFQKVEKFDKTRWIDNFDAVLYAFYGRNIECYVDLLQAQKATDVEKFMKNVKKNLPSIDTSKQQRIAFIIRCVGRKYGKFETELFFQHFPDTPAFVILSYGEFAYRANTGKYTSGKKIKMSSVEITYTFSTVYFFLTINLSA